MTMEIFDDEPNTAEWLRNRAGMPTASMFDVVIAKPGPRGGMPKGRLTYLYKLAGERLTGEPMDSYSNSNMERGHAREAEAADLYGLLRDIEPQRVGFIKNGNCGASPDRLIGKNGLLEIKDAVPHIQIERLLKGELPPADKAQVQGQLMVAEREWNDWMSNCRGMPPLIIRVERDEKYIAALRIDITDFVDELDELTEKIRRM